MGLFSSDFNADNRLFRGFLTTLSKEWNGCQGKIFDHSVAVNDSKIAQFLDTAEKVMEIHFPPKPSAFKRLGTWLILSQHIPPLQFLTPKGEILAIKDDCDWMPRIAVGGLPVAAAKMTVFTNEGEIRLEPFIFPSPHFQTEVISILRHYRLQSIKDSSLISPAMLAERAFNASLFVEAAYYVHILENTVSSHGDTDQRLQGKIEGCLANFDATQVIDIIFNDEDKLVMATEMGD